jgi:predicted DNA-binding transcriptional regulator YafY
MSRTERLLELLIKVQTTPRFTAEEMAVEFGVSRRTMLRDLQALSAMGIPLAARPGPYGGYELISRGRTLALSLSIDEALGMILSYEAFLQYTASPFAAQSLAAITRLRAALPPDVVRQLDRIHRHVVVVQPAPSYRAPLLSAILQAALDEVHLDIVYDSRSGVSARRIFPRGLFAEHGFWYCACHDDRRQMELTLRVDRFLSLERVEGLAPPPAVSLREWLQTRESNPEHPLPLRVRVTRQGARSFDLAVLFRGIAVGERGEGSIEGEIPASEIEFYARRLLALGTDVVVESPSELIEAMRHLARDVLALYDGQSPSHDGDLIEVELPSDPHPALDPGEGQDPDQG